jgi:polar amino acid transport system ATP-binding protein
MQMQGGIQRFGEKYGLGPRQINRLQICCEELIVELLDHCYPGREDADLELSVSHAELDGTTQIDVACGRAAYNPFEQAEEDVLSVTILKNISKRLEYRWENGRNIIDIAL